MEPERRDAAHHHAPWKQCEEMTMKSGSAVLVTAVASSLALAGCFSSSSSSGGGSGSNIGSLEYDTDGVFQQRVAINSEDDFEAIADEMGRVDGEDGPYGLLADLEGILVGDSGVTSLSLQSSDSSTESWADRRATRQERRERYTEASLQEADTEESTIECADGGNIVITETYFADDDSERWSEDVRINDCVINDTPLGPISLAGRVQFEGAETWTDDEWTGEESANFNITGTIGGEDLALVGSEEWEWRDTEMPDGGYEFSDAGEIPRLEYRRGDQYWAIVDGKFSGEASEDAGTGLINGTESFEMKIGSSGLQGYAVMETTKTLEFENVSWSDYCPTRGIVAFTGDPGKAEILFGEDTGVAGQAVAITVNDNPHKDFATCDAFLEEYWFFD